VLVASLVLACASAPRPLPATAPSPAPVPPATTAAERLASEGRAALAAGDATLGAALEDARHRILAQTLEKDRLDNRAPVSEEDVRRYYESHLAEFDQPQRLKLRHVFKRVARDASPAERDRVRAEMVTILERLRAGEDFGAVAKETSDSETAGHGGQIPPHARGGLPPSIESVVWTLQEGQLSDVVPTPVGFHVFRLDAVLPARKVSLEEARERIQRRLATHREAEARESLFQDLLRESGARYVPEILARRPLEGDPELFSVGARRVTLDDVVAAWRKLPFERQRLEGLADVLKEAARRELYAWGARHRGILARPDKAADLAAAETGALTDWAFERRLTSLLRGPHDEEVAAYFRENRARFAQPDRYRMRILSRRYPDDRVPYAAYEELEKLSREIKSGARDFASAAREISDDPSGMDGGRLGWVGLYEFATWAGYEAGNRLTHLAPGTVSDPWLIEVYQPDRMVHRRDGYMLVLVEEVEKAPKVTLDEVRERVERAYAAQHAGELRAEIEAAVLAGH
jgi:parvulin-like peptidyl-prolyl isomerase